MRKLYTRYSPEEKKSLLENYSKSGLSKKAFCKSQGIRRSTFYRWLEKSPQLLDLPESEGFESLEITSSPVLNPDPKTYLEIETPSGYRLRWFQPCSGKEVGQIISALNQ